MSDERAYYVVGPPGSARDRLVEGIEASPEEIVEEVDELLPLDARPPGALILLLPEVAAADVLRVVDAAGDADDWVVGLVRNPDAEAGPVVRTLAFGYRRTLEEVDRWLAGDAGSTLLDLRNVVQEISRARHDINNPLTSGLAETQLLLMDPHEDEVRESLETIQNQLRRIRDLVVGLGHIRDPG